MPRRHEARAPGRPAHALHHYARVLPADFTFGHAGRQFRFGPVAFWSAVGTLVIMAAWTLATASYFAFHDDLLTRLIARQAQMQYGYEDRVAELRMQVDRLASRQMLDQEQYEQRLSRLVRRESVLESRASTLTTIPDLAPTGSTKSRTNLGNERSALDPQKPMPIGDTADLSPIERQPQFEWHAAPGTAGIAAGQKSRIDVALARLEQSLGRVETKQATTLEGLGEEYDAKARRMRGVLSDLGLNPSKASAKVAGAAVGGPFVPAKLPPASNVFERQLYRVSLARSEVDLLNRALVTVPVRKPLPREVDVTSGFGVRLDPFLHRAAMHTGVDFRGEEGEPIHATASGTVTHAGWGGGYGRMVEIDHGNGIATRYGHLSAVDVEVGQHVHVGDVVGRLGSTGRSTGPHLHYETRVDNEAVDPQRFLHAGLRLSGAASQD